MQHRYVPDLGDFSKFAVIDALSGRGTLRTALVWYLVDPHEVGDAHKNDGKHTDYLEHDRQRLAGCHPDLYAKFQTIYATGEKHVGVYPRQAVLPNIAYIDEPLSYAELKANDRAAWREGWAMRVIDAAQTADLVVLDPDNGLAGDHLSVQSKSAVKYATLDECAGFYGRGERTLVLYQHAHRQGTVQSQAERALDRLATHLGVARRRAFALRFHRGTSRCYLVIPSKRHELAMRANAATLIESLWGQRGHFSLID